MSDLNSLSAYLKNAAKNACTNLRSMKSHFGKSGLVLLKLKYFIFWYGLLSFLSCVLHVYRKKGLFIANLPVNSCSLFDQSNYSIILFCHENLYLHRSKLLVPARRIVKAKHMFTQRFSLFCNVAGIIEKDWQLISLFKNIRDPAIMLIL